MNWQVDKKLVDELASWQKVSWWIGKYIKWQLMKQQGDEMASWKKAVDEMVVDETT